MSTENLSRERVGGVLSNLAEHIQSRLPDKEAIASQLARLMSGERSQAWERKPEGLESAFIGEYVLPSVEEFLRGPANERSEGDPLGLIRVGFSAPQKYASCGYAFFPGHLFGKVFRKPEAIYTRWRGVSERAHSALIQAWPDFTLLSPYRILFECKYFKKPLKSPAKVELVTDLYQAFFYRALPSREPQGKQSGWNYEYACYLAYDATDGAWLLKAWEGLPEKVRNSFWKQANIFVMILSDRGHER